MSVVGFDIGNDNCVVAVVKQRGIDVLLNDESKRETPAVVSFGEKQRFLGSAGASSATMNPKSTISQVKRLIGRQYMDPDVQNDLRMFPFQTSVGQGGGIFINLRYLGEIHSFTPVQILGMLFSHLKQISEKNIGTPVSDCVIGIPSYFTDIQRRAYLNAASIAGLKPLRLMHDCTAIALGYGIYKTDLSVSGATYVVFIDIGHCDTQVCIASFEAGNLRILAHAFDWNLGGRDFDDVLFNYFASHFKEQYHIDVHTNVKASLRLRSSCEKVKKVLSANAEAQINIECLMDEKDVKGIIKREDFEKLSSGLLERISIPCHKALVDSGLGVENICSVELIGSGSRIPAIARSVASLFHREPSRTLNASECVARGCALQCAMLSPIFRVRDYEVQDSFPFSICFSIDGGHSICTSPDGILFRKGQLFPSVKMLTLHKTSTFHVEAFYADQNQLSTGISPKISLFTIGPFQASHQGKAKIKVRSQLNIHGIIIVESATLIGALVDDPVAKFENMGDESENGSYNIENGDEGNIRAQSKPSLTSSVYDDVNSIHNKRVEIPISEFVYGGMTNVELSEAEQKEIQLAQQDIRMEQTKDKKNALESYVYEMRNMILNKYRSFASESERECISRNLQRTEDWLYEDGVDESETIYSEKLEDLKKLVLPVDNRYIDVEARAEATRALLKHISDYRIAAKSLSSHQRDSVLSECNQTEEWLHEKTQEQDLLAKNADPILWSSEIRKKSEALDVACKHMMRSDKEDDHMQVD